MSRTASQYPHDRVIITCDHCGRRGEYTRERFAELVGSETDLPVREKHYSEVGLNYAAVLIIKACVPHLSETDRSKVAAACALMVATENVINLKRSFWSLAWGAAFEGSFDQFKCHF